VKKILNIFPDDDTIYQIYKLLNDIFIYGKLVLELAENNPILSIKAAKVRRNMKWDLEVDVIPYGERNKKSQNIVLARGFHDNQ
jgi:hypothetical protein